MTNPEVVKSDIERGIRMVREALSATAFGSWAPEARRPDQRVALDALARLSTELERLERLRAIERAARAMDASCYHAASDICERFADLRALLSPEGEPS